VAYQIPPPPEGRFGKWAYQLWDYVARNRYGAGTANGIVGNSPITIGTGSSGTFTVGHAVSGVTPGTYGNSTAAAQVSVDTRGHVVSAANVAIAFPAPRALEGTAPIAVATAAGTYTVSHNTSGVAAGTYGAAFVTNQLVVDARGHVTSGTNAGTLGTFASFNSFAVAGAVTGTTTTGTLTTAQTLVAAGVVTGTTTTGTLTTAQNWTQVGAGDVLGTSTTGTFTGALSTTGVTAGTYGAARITSQLVVDAKGRLTSASQAGTLGTFAGFNSLVLAGLVTGTTTTGTLTSSGITGTLVVNGFLQVGTGASVFYALDVKSPINLGRNNTSDEGGELRFERASDAAVSYVLDIAGGGTTPSIRILDANQSPITVPWSISSPAGRWSGAPGGFGLGTGNVGLNYNGHGNFQFYYAGAGGPNFQLTGTGATPSKFLRVDGGQLQLVNNAYSAVVFSITDGGDIALSGAASIAGTLTSVAAQTRFALGSSATLGNTLVRGTAITTPVALSTGTTTAMSYAVPASALAVAGQSFRVIAWGTTALNLTTMNLELAGVVLGTGQTSFNYKRWQFDADVVAMGASSQRYRCRWECTGDAGDSQTSHGALITEGTMALTGASANTLLVRAGRTGTFTAAQQGMIVDVRN